ncbi:MAG TPA: HisA/HisF-related TIM barrel protein [Methylovirgula sp.]|nr:HisA/HisF-related TIM barrel protein [Methylovirgula sp.]
MEIIPVIDLKGGQVVRAAHGARHLYAPIETPLSPTSAPQDVVAGFLKLHPFRTLYIADLDAIEGRGSHADVIAALEAAFPSIAFWVDAGIENAADAKALLERSRGVVVLGSESLRNAEVLKELAQEARAILSLDYRGDDFQGASEIVQDSAFWPERLIVMTLARVGSGAGPDLTRLQEVVARAGKRRVYAAGGLRGVDDIAVLKALSVSGVLVASALHDGRLDAKILAELDANESAEDDAS